MQEMNTLFNMGSAAVSTAWEYNHVQWEKECRDEDMAYREIEIQRRLIDDSRRAVSEKAEQLKAVGSLSALIAGFAMIVQTEVTIPNDLDPVLLGFLAGVTALVVSIMLVAMLNSTFLLIAVYKYDCFKPSFSFEDYWASHCEADWKTAFFAFTTGIPLFLCMLTLSAWVVFWEHQQGNIAASVVTSIAMLTGLAWFATNFHKWGDFLKKGNKRYVPTENELGCNDDVDDNHNNNTNHNNTNGVDFSDIDKVSKTDSLGLDHESPNGDGKEGYFENAEGSQQIRQDVNNEKQRRQQGTNHPSSFDSMQRGSHPNTESAAVEDHIDVNATNSAEIDGRHYAAAGVSVGEKNSYNNGGGGHSKRAGTSTSTSNFMGSFTGMFSPSTSSIGKQPPNS